MQNFTDYIKIIKILRNISTQNEEFFKLVRSFFYSFVKKPSLFNITNIKELIEVDEIHISLFDFDDLRQKFENDRESRLKAK